MHTIIGIYIAATVIIKFMLLFYSLFTIVYCTNVSYVAIGSTVTINQISIV